MVIADASMLLADIAELLQHGVVFVVVGRDEQRIELRCPVSFTLDGNADNLGPGLAPRMERRSIGEGQTVHDEMGDANGGVAGGAHLEDLEIRLGLSQICDIVHELDIGNDGHVLVNVDSATAGAEATDGPNCLGDVAGLGNLVSGKCAKDEIVSVQRLTVSEVPPQIIFV